MQNKNRKQNRLPDFDYSQNGIYFITICAKDKKCFFGKIVNNEIILNDFGKIVKKCWLDLPNHYATCKLDEFIVMPNHVHGIIEIVNLNNVGTGFKPVPTKRYNLSEIIRGFKTFSSRRINEISKYNKFQWQRSFYDHIIRKNESLNKIREYIKINPKEWRKDENNPDL